MIERRLIPPVRTLLRNTFSNPFLRENTFETTVLARGSHRHEYNANGRLGGYPLLKVRHDTRLNAKTLFSRYKFIKQPIK